MIGSGFGTGIALKDIAFGPCGDLFVSRHSTDEILRIATGACPCGSGADPDLDGNGTVDGGALGLRLGAWGGASCDADLDGNGVVNGADLGLLLGGWG